MLSWRWGTHGLWSQPARCAITVDKWKGKNRNWIKKSIYPFLKDYWVGEESGGDWGGYWCLMMDEFSICNDLNLNIHSWYPINKIDGPASPSG